MEYKEHTPQVSKLRC